MHVHVKVKAAATDVFTQQATGIGRLNRLVEAFGAEGKFSPDVDIGRVGVDGVGGDQNAFEQDVSVPLNERTVLEGSRLALIRIGAQVDRFVRVFRQKAPTSCRPQTRPRPGRADWSL